MTFHIKSLLITLGSLLLAVSQVIAAETLAADRHLIANSVTVAVNNDNVLPIKDVSNGKIQLLSLGVGDMFKTRCQCYANIKVCSSASSVDANNGGELIIAIGKERLASEALAAARKCGHVIMVVLDTPNKMQAYADLVTDASVDAVVFGYGSDDLWQDYAAQTVFGGNAATGVLPLTVTSQANNAALGAGDGVHYAANRLGYALPAEVGLADDLIAKIDSVCNYGVGEKAFSGCQVLVARHGKVVVDRSYGEINFGSGVPVTRNTLFDLASVSKATGTLSGIMKLCDEGKIKLDEPASKYIEGLRGTDKSTLTFSQLLYHETGLKPSLNMWQMMFDPTTYSGKLISDTPTRANTIKVMKNAFGNKDAALRTDILAFEPSREFGAPIAHGLYGSKATYDSIMTRIYHSTLRPDKNYCYSCLNFCLLANALEIVTHSKMDAYLDKTIFGSLGAYHTTYLPLNKFSPDDIAFTEVDTYLRKQHIHGYVHDELAAFSGGVQGNAGLFSNANDLAKLFQMWLNGGQYGGKTYYKKSTVDTFLKSKSPNSHRGLGFDKPNLKNKSASNTCDEATAETVGHTGFTGTRFWVDPKNDMIYIFLSNRVCPTRDNPAFSRVSASSHIQSFLYQSIEK